MGIIWFLLHLQDIDNYFHLENNFGWVSKKINENTNTNLNVEVEESEETNELLKTN